MDKFKDLNGWFVSLETGMTERHKFRDRWWILLKAIIYSSVPVALVPQFLLPSDVCLSFITSSDLGRCRFVFCLLPFCGPMMSAWCFDFLGQHAHFLFNWVSASLPPNTIHFPHFFVLSSCLAFGDELRCGSICLCLISFDVPLFWFGFSSLGFVICMNFWWFFSVVFSRWLVGDEPIAATMVCGSAICLICLLFHVILFRFSSLGFVDSLKVWGFAPSFLCDS